MVLDLQVERHGTCHWDRFQVRRAHTATEVDPAENLPWSLGDDHVPQHGVVAEHQNAVDASPHVDLDHSADRSCGDDPGKRVVRVLGEADDR